MRRLGYGVCPNDLGLLGSADAKVGEILKKIIVIIRVMIFMIMMMIQSSHF